MLNYLQPYFDLEKVHKTYLAICHGEIDKTKGSLDSNLIRYENGKKIIEKAKTYFKVLDKKFNIIFNRNETYYR